MVVEVITDWSTPAGGGFASVMYFPDEPLIGTVRAAIGAFFNDFDGQLGSGTTWRVRNEGRILNTASGALTGLWQDAGVFSGVGGDGASAPVPDVAQILVRWRTSGVVNGRLLRGRTFVPGAVVGDVANGNVGSTLLNEVNAAVTTFLASAADFSIWHRPKNGAGGVLHPVSSGSCWTEYASLRRRRR